MKAFNVYLVKTNGQKTHVGVAGGKNTVDAAAEMKALRKALGFTLNAGETYRAE